MPDKLTPEITPQLAISAFAVLHQYCAQSVHMTASDVHFTNIARDASWDVREIRARRSGNYKATDKIRESVFTGSPFYVYIFQFSLHFLNDSPYTAAALLEDMP